MDDAPHAIYFIECGIVVLTREDGGKNLASLDRGSYFGELPFLFCDVALQPFTVKTLTESSLFTLAAAHFEQIRDLFSELKPLMILIAQQRLLKMGVSLEQISSERPESATARSRDHMSKSILEDLFARRETLSLAERRAVEKLVLDAPTPLSAKRLFRMAKGLGSPRGTPRGTSLPAVDTPKPPALRPLRASLPSQFESNDLLRPLSVRNRPHRRRSFTDAGTPVLSSPPPAPRTLKPPASP